jgi:hypothetical protein
MVLSVGDGARYIPVYTAVSVLALVDRSQVCQLSDNPPSYFGGAERQASGNDQYQKEQQIRPIPFLSKPGNRL